MPKGKHMINNKQQRAAQRAARCCVYYGSCFYAVRLLVATQHHSSVSPSCSERNSKTSSEVAMLHSSNIPRSKFNY